jgi:hypothetical protein
MSIAKYCKGDSLLLGYKSWGISVAAVWFRTVQNQTKPLGSVQIWFSLTCLDNGSVQVWSCG